MYMAIYLIFTAVQYQLYNLIFMIIRFKAKIYGNKRKVLYKLKKGEHYAKNLY